VQKNGVPELVQALDQGKVPVATAAKIAKLPREEQRVRLNARPEQKKTRKPRWWALYALDATTRTILEGHKITRLQKELRALGGIGGSHNVTPKQRLTLRHSVATMVKNGRAENVEEAKNLILREWADSKLTNVGTDAGLTNGSN